MDGEFAAADGRKLAWAALSLMLAVVRQFA